MKLSLFCEWNTVSLQHSNNDMSEEVGFKYIPEKLDVAYVDACTVYWIIQAWQFSKYGKRESEDE